MSFSPPPQKKGSSRRVHLAAEINVTPMVDVMLVLLVIFMITAPLLTAGVPVNLPKTKAPALNEDEKPLTVTINEKGSIILQETEIDPAALVPRLVAITGANPETRIYIKGDQILSYGQVMKIIGEVSTAGFTKVALISEPLGAEGSLPPKSNSRK